MSGGRGAVHQDCYPTNSYPITISLPNTCSVSPFAKRRDVADSCIGGSGPSIVVGVISTAGLDHDLFFAARLLRLNVPVIITLGGDSVGHGGRAGVSISILSTGLNYPIMRATTTSTSNLDLIIGATVRRMNGTPAPACERTPIGPLSQTTMATTSHRHFTFIGRVITRIRDHHRHSGRFNMRSGVSHILAGG